ncbi:hypothetical protein BJ878DRAFT_566011 [Calycina marina]|uniref:DUF221-domain-containing protein n=1 Tax=Calycina marina TaxID=1763456 RepID=A0A9P7Z6W1_9HELO|nr:hypothetical protein BJ878DRAFT_566011 [Calycina marina]
MSDTPTEDTPDTSISQVVATLAPTLPAALIYFAIFLILRKSNRRWYSPRTYLGTMREQERTAPLPNGMFNWMKPFSSIPDTYALQHQSLDAFLFLRFLKMTIVVMFVGTCITWPVLFPVNITGGNGLEQLNMLTYGNVNTTNPSGYRFFAHAGCAVIFYGFVLFLVTRETMYYINLRQAFLLSPIYANRISARTVLFTAVPKQYLNERALRKTFGSAVRRVWVTADTEEVDNLVDERDKVSFRLENAEVKLIKAANGARLKAIKKAGHNEEEPLEHAQGDAESGSVAARWVPTKKRPTHKLGKFGLFGKKVDSIDWCRSRLETLIPEVEAAQANYRAGNTSKTGSVFIEFARQTDAQAAYQTLSHHQALHMSPRYIGVNPNELIWKSLKISWWQRVIRRFVVIGFICALIIFWAIPVAAVGIISNVSYLVNISWLTWLQKIPSSILGVVSGLLPSVALSILMSLVPIIMRICAKLSGEPSSARVELFTQNAYFAFQFIQVFLVVTLGSVASAIVPQIIDDPTSITSLLAEKIPSVSNFYLTYFIVQGLSIASSVISQVVGFIIFKILYMLLAGTPRKMYQKWASLSAISWGSTLPPLTMIACIGIIYAVIAPLILAFATIGMSLFYLAYRYNILFVSDSRIDTKGLIYPRALQQLMTGIYIGELVYIGMFSISEAIGPVIIMVVMLVFTVLYHMSINAAFEPLLANLPKSIEYEEAEHLLRSADTNGHGHDEKVGEHAETAVATKKPNFLTKFLKPHIFADYHELRKLIPHGLVNADDMYDELTANNAYFPPSVVSMTPLLWIPRDDMGISRQEAGHTSKVIPITDEGCTLSEKNKLVWDEEGARPPLWQEKIYY